MGVTKQYLRYAPSAVFGVIGSHKSNVVFLEIHGNKGKFCAVGACENVIIWDMRKGEKHLELKGEKHEVTVIAKSPSQRHVAVGYHDGTVRIFDVLTGECTVKFSGHKSAVSALNYDKTGVRLASGAKDTDIIVWDIVNESGLYRLKGHKGMVTQVRFFNNRNLLISSSKDTFVKFWDLDTQHCFKTLVGHRTEVWDLVLFHDEHRLITGSADSELRVWKMLYLDEESEGPNPAKKAKQTENEEEEEEEDAEEEEEMILACHKLGSLMRQGRDRVVSIVSDPSGRILGCHGNENTLEVFKLVSEEEIEKHLHKKQKRARKRARETGQEGLSENVTQTVEDEIQRLSLTKLSSKIRSFDCIVDSAEVAKIVCHLSNNTLELQSLNIKEKKPVAECVTKLSSAGHRSDVRSVCFSSDNTAVLSTSGETMKVWNRTTQQCIRTIDCEYGLCSMFAPGDRHAIIGSKSGKLQIFDIASGSLLENVEAHSGAVWSVCMAPDKRGIISGSADKEVKFWDFELVTDEKYSKTSKRLTLVHTRTLKMSEEVLCVKYSPDQRLVAVSLLDSTVKVFFADTLKFFLSLYGHKLPVTCMDISSDSSLLVTGSADRNVKLWGLDFGDCHKSIFAHDDSIMCVQFVTKTHMFFTGGKDKKLKEWDGDNFEHIQTLEGHHAEIWCLAVSPNGKHVVTGAHDKSLRIWEKTDEPLVLEEEKEMEREKEYEEAIADGEEPVVPGEADSEVGMAGKKTVETVKSAEKLMEAVEVYREETAKYTDHEAECKRTGKELPPPQLHPLFQAYGVSTPAKYVLEIIRRIKSSELEESLLVLPFSYIPDLLGLLSMFIDNGWEVELTCRCLLFLLRIHHGQITSNQVMVPVIEKLKTNTSSKVGELKDIFGFNMAGLQFLKQQMEQKEEVNFFADATDRFSQKKKKQKSKAILAFKT